MHLAATGLLQALETKDAALFARLSTDVKRSQANMLPCGKDLISVVARAQIDPALAECALNALRFSGLANDDEIHGELLATARELFPKGELALTAKAEKCRVRERRQRMPAKVRILKGIVFAMLRKGEADGLAFVKSIEEFFSDTPLALDISSARDLDDGNDDRKR